jgi:hypothetical protein
MPRGMGAEALFLLSVIKISFFRSPIPSWIVLFAFSGPCSVPAVSLYRSAPVYFSFLHFLFPSPIQTLLGPRNGAKGAVNVPKISPFTVVSSSFCSPRISFP